MTWRGAWLRGLAIFAYFLVATVWLPDFVIGLGVIADASTTVRDAVLVVVWGGALAGGMWLLRRGQDRGVI